MEQIYDEICQRILDLKDLVAKTLKKKELDGEFKEICDKLKEDTSNLKDLLSKLPEQIAAMLKTLDEMEKGSTLDETADYWEERKDIEKWIEGLQKV